MGQYIPLDVKSLMIEDWVKCLDSGVTNTYNKEFFKVVGFFSGQIMLLVEENQATAVFDSDIEPIQLTKEILEKNGFEEDFYSIITANGFERLPEYKYKNMKEARDIRRNLIRVAYSNTEGGVYDIQAGIGSHIFSLKYVHELQHALRIMKIDKEIVI